MISVFLINGCILTNGLNCKIISSIITLSSVINLKLPFLGFVFGILDSKLSL
jgi:hypothetical protein